MGFWNRVVDSVKLTKSDDTKKLNKKLKKGKEVKVNKVISSRYYNPGSNGSFLDDDATVASLDDGGNKIEVEVPSTAVDEVKYDPKTKVCEVKFVSGNKWYKYENMSEQQFQSFMNASSKGRYVNNVMKVQNRAKGY